MWILNQWWNIFFTVPCILLKDVLSIAIIENNLLDLFEPVLIKTLLFGSNSFDTNANTNVLNATIEHVLSTKIFQEPLFQWSQQIFKRSSKPVNAVSTVMVVNFLLFADFYSDFFRIFLFRGTITILGIWWLSLLIWQCMI